MIFAHFARKLSLFCGGWPLGRPQGAKIAPWPHSGPRPWCLENSGTSLAGPKSQKLLRNGLEQPNLGNESIYLHLPDLTDTISYAVWPGDAKNDAKTTSRSTHIESQKRKNHEFGYEMALDGSI